MPSPTLRPPPNSETRHRHQHQHQRPPRSVRIRYLLTHLQPRPFVMGSHGEPFRSLEPTLESEITMYAKLCTSVSTAYSSNGKLSERTISKCREVEERIEDNLEQLSSQVDQIYRLLQTSSIPPTGSVTHACNRHKEVLQEYEQDFKRTRTSLQECEQRASLLSEISSFKSLQITSEEDRHLNDRSSINSSHCSADDVLGQAYETSPSSLLCTSTTATVPGVNSLISMINSQRRRDTLILASVAGGCTFMLLLLTFR
ncbi:hypothetical protein PSHT_02211 [Puccinia striiformis]|uniref:Golgi SNAP receptor complex member 1 n=1 Tax=Puccinia striiformis TaxID=27350 RepID=A0A2S4WIL6_9BASI|nr:hypothetical protein PSHT_02211 [Puccinia striiformis]